MKGTVDRAVVRAALLGAQGLLDDPERKLTKVSLRRAIEAMGFVQLDSIATVARAHHLTLGSRFDGYRPGVLTHLLEKDRSLFEQWTHDAAAIPTPWFAHWKPRFERERLRIHKNAWWRERMGEEPERVLARVEERVRREGPILARDFESPKNEGPRAEQGWWGWRPTKAALELLWRTGKLTIVRREHFQKVYDLTERVLPDHHVTRAPSAEEHIGWAAKSALDRLNFATATEVSAFWRSITIAQAKTWLEAAERAGDVVRLTIKEPGPARPRVVFAHADWERRVARLPEAPDRVRLLSPFDPILRDRARTERLFGFNYRFEAFVPGPKRQFGYYVLPILEGDRLIGRIEPKLHRQKGEIEVLGTWWEPKIAANRKRLNRLDEALERLASQVGAKTITRRM